MTEKEIIKMPGIDLHCHLDGSLSRECLSVLLNRPVSWEEVQVDMKCESLAQYLEKFDLPLQCLQTEKGLMAAGTDFIRTAAEDGLCYVEVRFAPMLSVQKGLSCSRVMEAVLKGLEAGRKKYGVEYNVIACAMRHHTYQQNMRMVEEVKDFYGKGLCAIDLAGNEAAYPMEEFEELFRNVKKEGIPFTIHAGECGRVENVVRAVELGAGRIGHGIALKGHKEAIKICREHHVGIEMCPRSNLQTKAVRNIKDYPIREFISEGLMVTINTDNRTVSSTSMGKEIQCVKENWGITDEEIHQMMRQAVEVSFADDTLKEKLRQIVK